MKKAGIILKNYSGSEINDIAQDSLNNAENDISWDLYVAGEGPDGVSEGIRHFLEQEDITHVCLLNPDVIVTHHWLDSLTADGLDIAGPVTNIAGNEQTIAVDIDPPQDETGFTKVSAFAWKRQTAFEGCSCASDLIAFFAVVLTREVVETVGLIDERFTNGYFADDDYCMRALNEGFGIRVLRDCYVHNFGGGPFSHILNDDNFESWQEGQGPYEEKWGLKWQPRGWKLLKSCVQDAEFLDGRVQETQWAKDLLVQGFADHFNLLREENPELRERYRVELPFGENVRQLKKKIRRRISPSLRHENPRYIKKEKEREIRERALAVQAEALDGIRQSGKKAVLVLAPFFTGENSADGYLKRVKAIDEGALDGYFKVYADLEKPRIAPAVRGVDEKHIEIWLSPENEAQAGALREIAKACSMIYVHSAMRVLRDTLPDRVRDLLLADKGAEVVWDVHGAVPEEYALNDDYYNAQLADEAEKFLFEHSRTQIVVTDAMRKHLEEKYKGKPKATVITLPVFGDEDLKPVDCSKEKALKEWQPPLAVYAGGLQEWQKIGEMQSLIERAGDHCRYAVFAPRPDEFRRLWGGRKYPAEMRIERKQPRQVKEEYKACHYGFVLRDDIAVNNVACPTKLVEYLQYGIVPVMSMPNIGDFSAMGMEYVDAVAFGRGKLPSEGERQRMAEKNYEVLKKLSEAYREGTKAVLKCRAAES